MSEINSYPYLLQSAIKNYQLAHYSPKNNMPKIRLLFDITRLATNPGHSGINKTLNCCINALHDSGCFTISYCLQKDYLKSSSPLSLDPLIQNSLIELGDANPDDFDIYLSIYHPVSSKFLCTPHVKTCLCVHDIFHLTRKDLYPNPGKFITNDIVRNAFEVDCVFTPSRFSLDQLSNYKTSQRLKCAHVINWPVVIPDINSNELGNSKNSELDVLFAYQNNDPRKNIDLVVKVINNMLRERPSLRVGLFGKINKFDVGIFPVDSNVCLYNSPSDDELFRIYSQSKLFLYLSLSEGFGLPPLEAISLGCIPVMFKNSALKEIFPNLPLINDNAACPASIARVAIKLLDGNPISDAQRSLFRSAYSYDGFKSGLSLMLKSLLLGSWL